MIEVYLHTKYSISDFKIKECKLLNSTAIANGYAGRDPQGGTSDGSFSSKIQFNSLAISIYFQIVK